MYMDRAKVCVSSYKLIENHLVVWQCNIFKKSLGKQMRDNLIWALFRMNTNQKMIQVKFQLMKVVCVKASIRD